MVLKFNFRRIKMAHDDFYRITYEMSNSLRCAPYNYSETSIDERESYFKGGEYAKNMPREFITIDGRAKKDFLFGSAGLLLVSDRVKNKLEEIKATGVEFVSDNFAEFINGLKNITL